MSGTFGAEIQSWIGDVAVSILSGSVQGVGMEAGIPVLANVVCVEHASGAHHQR
jgi:hypothetical protein